MVRDLRRVVSCEISSLAAARSSEQEAIKGDVRGIPLELRLREAAVKWGLSSLVC